MMIALRSVLLLVLFLAPTNAHARCEGAMMLGTLHNAYRTVLEDAGGRGRQAAATLLFIAGGQDSADFADRISLSGVAVSSSRLGQILTDAKTLATQTLEDTRRQDYEFRHGRNVDWLADTFLSTGCADSPQAASRTPTATSLSVSPGFGSPEKAHLEPADLLWRALLIALLLIALGFSIYRMRTSFAMRRRRAERQPRTPIKLSLTASYAFPDGEIRAMDADAVDISVGGMKLSWPNAPPVGTVVTLAGPLPETTCRITWSNSFYAGIIFEQQLTQDELERYKKRGQPKRAEKQNGAEYGAA